MCVEHSYAQFRISFSRPCSFSFFPLPGCSLCTQEDHGGEVDDNDDLELVQDQKDHAGVQGADGKKEDYY